MNEKCVKGNNEKLSIKDFLAQDVEEQGIEMMVNEKVVPFGVTIWL